MDSNLTGYRPTFEINTVWVFGTAMGLKFFKFK